MGYAVTKLCYEIEICSIIHSLKYHICSNRSENTVSLTPFIPGVGWDYKPICNVLAKETLFWLKLKVLSKMYSNFPSKFQPLPTLKFSSRASYSELGTWDQLNWWDNFSFSQKILDENTVKRNFYNNFSCLRRTTDQSDSNDPGRRGSFKNQGKANKHFYDQSLLGLLKDFQHKDWLVGSL